MQGIGSRLRSFLPESGEKPVASHLRGDPRVLESYRKGFEPAEDGTLAPAQLPGG